ncbi:MAG: hypothetical protein M1611_02025 [Candidatus Marsarchaeota archaeon]|nr:hypothetical protein [Candidatus Marsarchaeota archaeon]
MLRGEINYVGLKAKRLYRKFGFRTWGIAPDYIKRGKYMDLEYMYLKL